MIRNLIRLAVVTVAAILVGVAGTAQGDETDRGGYELVLSTTKPGAPTGLEFHVLYKNPEDPEGKPPPVTGAVFELPEGLRFDSSAVPLCTASDSDFRALGRQACPPESQVGEGELTAITGFPGADPVTADVVAFNGDGELVEVVFVQGTNAVAGMDRLTIENGTLVAHPPSTPGGPPDGRTSVRELRLELPPRIGDGGRAYVTAPPECRTGLWTSRARYQFADGGQTALASTNSCDQPPIRVAREPARVREGERATLRIVARSAERRCVRRARVRAAGRRAQTDAKGHATLAVTFVNPGRKRVIVSKRGCETGSAAIRVMPRR